MKRLLSTLSNINQDRLVLNEKYELLEMMFDLKSTVEDLFYYIMDIVFALIEYDNRLEWLNTLLAHDYIDIHVYNRDRYGRVLCLFYHN